MQATIMDIIFLNIIEYTAVTGESDVYINNLQSNYSNFAIWKWL